MRTTYMNPESLHASIQSRNVLNQVKNLLNPNATNGTHTIALEFANNRTLYVAPGGSSFHILFELSNTVIDMLDWNAKLGGFMMHNVSPTPIGVNIWHVNNTNYRAVIINQIPPSPVSFDRVQVSMATTIPTSTSASILFLYDKVNDVFYAISDFLDNAFRKAHYWQGLTYMGQPEIKTCLQLKDWKSNPDNNIEAAELTINGVNFTTAYKIRFFVDLMGSDTHRENATSHAIVLGNMRPIYKLPNPYPTDFRDQALYGLVLDKSEWDV